MKTKLKSDQPESLSHIGFSPYAKITINKKTKEFEALCKIDEISNKNASAKIFVCGDLISIYHNKAFIDQKDAYAVLSECADDRDQLEKILVNAVGTFWIILQTSESISVYSSVRGHGLFIYETDENIHLYSSEREFFQSHIDAGFNDFACVHYITQRFSFRNPYSSLIESSRKIIGGQKIIFDGASTHEKFYLPINELSTDARPDAEVLEEFGLISEGCLEQQYEFYKTGTNYFEISGGIDSTYLFCAASKMKMDVKPVHDHKGAMLETYIEALCEKLGFSSPHYLKPPEDPEAIEAYQKQCINNIEIYFKNGLGMCGLGNMYAQPDFIKDKPLALGGHVIGVLYQGHPFMFPTFGLIPMLMKRKDEEKQKMRVLYANEFIEALNEGQRNPYGEAFSGSLPESGYEYLANMALSNKSPLAIKNHLPNELSEFEEEYRQEWVDTLLKPIFQERYDNLKSGKVSALEISQAMRVLRFATNVQSISTNTHNINSAGLYNQQDPPLEGPIVNFLMRRDVTMNEVKNPKNLEFMYFEKIMGQNYFRDFIPSKFIKLLFVRLSKQFRKDKLALKNRRELFAKKDVFKTFVRKYVEPQNSRVIDGITNPKIKAYISELYQKTYDDPSWDFSYVNNILNLEVFLKHLNDEI